MNSKAIALASHPTHHTFPCRLYIILLLFGISALPGCSSSAHKTIASDRINQTSTFDGINQTSMFDGESLGLWKKSDFYSSGNIYIKDGCIILEKSEWMTGVKWTGPLIRMNYAISFEAKRVEGDDFFCGVTFPVSDRTCSLILGGWGNKICGLSCINHRDASENETSLGMPLENNRWYKVDLQVIPDRIQAWLDDKLLVDVVTTGKDIDIRMECIPSQPLGIATYKTTGAIRNIHLHAFKD